MSADARSVPERHGQAAAPDARGHKRWRQRARQRNGYSAQRVDAMKMFFRHLLVNLILRDYAAVTGTASRRGAGAMEGGGQARDGETAVCGLSYALAETLKLAACFP